MNILKKILGTKNSRDLKRLRPLVAEINRIEAEYQAKNFTDEDFPRKPDTDKRPAVWKLKVEENRNATCTFLYDREGV